MGKTTKTTKNYSANLDDILETSAIKLDDTKSILQSMKERINLIYMLTIFNSLYLIFDGIKYFIH